MKWKSRGKGRAKVYTLHKLDRKDLPDYDPFYEYDLYPLAKVFRTKKNGWHYQVFPDKAVKADSWKEAIAVATALARMGG